MKKKSGIKKEKEAMTTKVQEKTERRVFSAKQKCEAVLSVWSERRKPSEVCKELEIKWANLGHWQDKALAAMMEALKPKSKEEEQKGPALGPKLEKLLEKTTRKATNLSKLEKRLEKIQETKEKAVK